MENRSVIHSTFVIERTWPASPERVFAALADPTIKRRWYADHETRKGVEYSMDFRVGGQEHSKSLLSENTPFPGVELRSDTVFQDIVPNRRVITAYTMSLGGKRISASLATFELLPAGSGTTLVFTDQGAYFEGADGPQMREGGWNKILDKLGDDLARHA